MVTLWTPTAGSVTPKSSADAGEIHAGGSRTGLAGSCRSTAGDVGPTARPVVGGVATPDEIDSPEVRAVLAAARVERQAALGV